MTPKMSPQARYVQSWQGPVTGTWQFTEEELNLFGLSPGDRFGPGIVGPPVQRAPELPEALRGIAPEVGSVWWWEPLDAAAQQEVRVTRVIWNGEECMVESEQLSGEGRYWNTLSRWVEATVLIRPAGVGAP